MRIDARHQNGSTRVRALVDDPLNRERNRMTGQPSDSACTLTVRYQQQVVVDATLTSTILSNPYFSIEFAGGEVGEELVVEWTDPQANRCSHTVLIG